MRTLIALVILAAVSLDNVAVAADGLLDPPSPPLGGTPLYDQFSPWQYTLDGNNSYFYQSVAGKQLELWTNALMVGKAWFVHSTIRVIQYATGLRLLDAISEPLLTLSDNLRWQFWTNPWITGALALTGLLALLLRIWQGQMTRAWAFLGLAGLTLLVGTWLAENTEGALRTITALPAGATDVVVQSAADVMAGLRSDTAPDNADNRPQWLLQTVGDHLWRTHVLDPWAELEFGSMTVAELYGTDGIPGSTVLAMTPSERQDWFIRLPLSQRTQDLTWWTDDYALRRFVLTLVGFVLTALVMMPLLLLSGGLLLYQVLAALLLVLSPLWMLLALWWPSSRDWLVLRLLRRGLSAIVMQVICALLLMVVLLAVSALPALDWLLASLLHGLLALAVFRYRLEWLKLFSQERRIGSVTRDKAVRSTLRESLARVYERRTREVYHQTTAMTAPDPPSPSPSAHIITPSASPEGKANAIESPVRSELYLRRVAQEAPAANFQDRMQDVRLSRQVPSAVPHAAPKAQHRPVSAVTVVLPQIMPLDQGAMRWSKRPGIDHARRTNTG